MNFELYCKHFECISIKGKKHTHKTGTEKAKSLFIQQLKVLCIHDEIIRI